MKSGTEHRRQGVQSLERTLDVLEFLGSSEQEFGVSEIGAATGLSAGTVHRLLGTLVSRGYVRRNQRTRQYSLGLRALTMAITARERIGPLALPFLEELVRASQETANLAVLEDGSTLYIEQAFPPTRTLRMFTDPGNRVPPHTTGTGKVLLAYQPPRLLEFILGRAGLSRQTVNTITDMSQLRAEFQQIRRDGYASDFEEQEEGVRCLAAPVFGPDGNIFAAMSVSGPASRLDQGRMDAIVPSLKRIANNPSSALDPA
ncbi:MAG: IclR family transcriptional regulator [Rubrobacter sp.]|nr:IclR family transcriptional regulator [Rubrobacter sp.]